MDDTAPRKWQDTFPGWSKHALVVPMVVAEMDLTPGAKLTYGLLRYLSWRNGNSDAEVSVEQAAAMIAVSKRAMDDYLAELRRAGLVDSVRRGLGQTNAYVLHPPPDNAQTLNGDAESAHQDRQDVRIPRARGSTGRTAVDKRTANKSVAATTRKRDVAFDAMAEVTNSDPTLEGSRIAKAVNALRRHPEYIAVKEQQGRDAAEAALAQAIRLRAVQYRETYAADVALTPQALVNNWKRVQKSGQSGRGMTAAEIMSMAQNSAEEER